MATMKLLPMLVVLLALCATLGAAQQFEEWLAEYGEVVAGLDPEEVYANWQLNVKFVEEHNRRASSGLSNFKLALNAFAHKKFPADSKSANGIPKPVPPPNPGTTVAATDIPKSVDWRTKGVVHPVADQGQMGHSNTFAIVRGAVDSYWAIKHGYLVYSSMVEFENCCAGAVMEGAYECIVKIGGLALQNVYPVNSTKCLNQKYKPVVIIDGGKHVPQGDEIAMAEIVAGQPVAVAVDVSDHAFGLYRSGVYRSENCSRHRADHMMLVVGYGTTPEGVDYWLCQNSWGKSWGMDGYVMIERNAQSMCGIADSASYPY